MIQWFVQLWAEHATLLAWLTTASLVMLVLSLLTLPVVAVLLPEDFIVARLRAGNAEGVSRDAKIPSLPATESPGQTPPGRVWPWTLRILKNLAGGLLALAGLAMLVLPGQGLLTLIVALVLLDLPGKQRLEARLLSQPRLLRMLNRTRQRFGRPPLRSP